MLIKYGVTRIVILIGNFAIKIPNFKNGQLNFLMGCVSNKRERTLFKSFVDFDGYSIYKYVAPSLYCSIFGLIQIQKRCEPLNRDLSDEEKQKFFEVCMGDLKRENFGLLDGNIVCLDY